MKSGPYSEMFDMLFGELRPELRARHSAAVSICGLFAEEMGKRRLEAEAERAAWAEKAEAERVAGDCIARADMAQQIVDIAKSKADLEAMVNAQAAELLLMRDAIFSALRSALRPGVDASAETLIGRLHRELAMREETLAQYRDYYDSGQRDAAAREDLRLALAAAQEREAKVSHDLALANAATEELQRLNATHRATIDNYQRHCADLQAAGVEMMLHFSKLSQRDRNRVDHHHVTASLRDHLPL